MTNKEAIDLISRNKSVFQYDTEMTKALNLAIKALANERPQIERDCFHCDYFNFSKSFTKNVVGRMLNNIETVDNLMTELNHDCGADMREEANNARDSK